MNCELTKFFGLCNVNLPRIQVSRLTMGTQSTEGGDGKWAVNTSLSVSQLKELIQVCNNNCMDLKC